MEFFWEVFQAASHLVASFPTYPPPPPPHTHIAEPSEAAVQEEHYLSIDGENTVLRKENWLLREDKDRLGQTLTAWKTRCEELELVCRETKV